MSTQLIVTLDKYPLQTTKIKSSPTTSLQSIVTQACTSFNLDSPLTYGLRYNKTDLDLTLSMRFANLPSTGTTKLILFRTNKRSTKNELLTIAIQIDDIGRFQVKVPASVTLLELLVYADSTLQLSITSTLEPTSITTLFKSSKKILEPRCIYMNQEISGFVKLSETLLSQIGLTTGNALVKVSFLKTGIDEYYVYELVGKCRLDLEDKFETLDYQNKKPAFNTSLIENASNAMTSEVDSKNVNEIVGSNTNNSETFSKHKDITIQEPIPQTWEQKVDLKIVKVFPVPVEELPESFYEISGVEARNFVKLPQVEMLKTKMIRDREAKEKADKYPTTNIRLKFPDSVMLQMTFSSFETAQSLFEYTEKILLPQFTQYNLFVSPPRIDIVRDKTFAEQHLAPSSIVHINFGTQPQVGPYIHKGLMSGLETTPQIQHALSVTEQAPARVENQAPSVDVSSESISTEKKMPKWFTNLNKKK